MGINLPIPLESSKLPLHRLTAPSNGTNVAIEWDGIRHRLGRQAPLIGTLYAIEWDDMRHRLGQNRSISFLISLPLHTT